MRQNRDGKYPSKKKNKGNHNRMLPLPSAHCVSAIVGARWIEKPVTMEIIAGSLIFPAKTKGFFLRQIDLI